MKREAKLCLGLSTLVIPRVNHHGSGTNRASVIFPI